MTRPFINLKIFNKNTGSVQMVATHKSRKVWLFLQANKFKGCVFNVCVNYDGEYKNEGEYNNKTDLIQALREFMEKDLIKEFNNG